MQYNPKATYVNLEDLNLWPIDKACSGNYWAYDKSPLVLEFIFYSTTFPTVIVFSWVLSFLLFIGLFNFKDN